MLASLQKKELSDEEVKKGAPVRTAFRSQILTDLESLNSSSMSIYDKMKASSSAKSYKKFVESELAWVNANPELSVRQVDSRSRVYSESSQQLVANILQEAQIGISTLSINDQKALSQQFPIVKYRKQFIDLVNQNSSKTQSEEQLKKDKEIQDIQNKSTWDIAKEAINYALFIGLIVLFIAIALRIASFCANDSLYKPPAYRILNFVYGFLFSPLILPYYLYREIWGWWNEDDNLRPHFESLIPLIPYEPKEDLTLGDRIYGFAKTPQLCEWIRCKQSVELCKKKNALVSDVLSKLKEEFAPKDISQ